MSVTRIDTTSGPGPIMSRCVVRGDMVYLAGLTAGDRSADVKGQTQQILDKIDEYLARAGSDKSKLLQANLWITDMANFAAMNEVWNAWVDPDNPPVRACVHAELAAVIRRGRLDPLERLAADGVIGDAIEQTGWLERIGALIERYPTKQLGGRIRDAFDGLRPLQFVHALEAAGRTRLPWAEAWRRADWLGVTKPRTENLTEQLSWLRRVDR